LQQYLPLTDPCPAAIKGLFDHLTGIARNSMSRKSQQKETCPWVKNIRQVDRVQR